MLPQVASETVDRTEMLIWIGSSAGAIFMAVSGFFLKLIKNIAKNKEDQLQAAFVAMDSKIQSINELVKEQKSVFEQVKKDTYIRLENAVKEFESKSESVIFSLHKLDIAVNLSEGKIVSILDMQKELKETANLAVRLDATLAALQRTVENFGKVVLKP